MNPPAAICLCGTGGIAERHMQAFESVGGVRPRWVVSRREESATDFAGRWKFERSGTSLEAALADPVVQLVVITSPSAVHCEQTLQALQAGRDVIVEIPLGLSLAETEQIVTASHAAGRRVWVCHTMRSFAAIREVRRRVAAGELSITHISGFMGIPRRRNQGMAGSRVSRRSWIDNLLWHHGCHQVDVSMWILGVTEFASVRALHGPTHPELGMPLDLGIQMLTSQKQLVTQALSYNVERVSWQLQFIGHEDVLTFDNGRLLNEAGEPVIPDSAITDLTVQNRELLQAWRRDEPSEYDLDRVRPAMEVLAQAQRSTEEAG